MTDERIIEAMKAHKRFSSKWVILTVPSIYVYESDHRNKNYSFTPQWVPLSFNDLERFAKAAGLKIIAEFGYGDLTNNDHLSLKERRELYRQGKANTLCLVCTV
jgi:hypothetical protein